MSDQPKKDWKALEKHYKKLSEVYQFAYDDQIRVSKAIMVLQGVFTEMYSELIKFQQKGGNNPNAENRLNTAIEQLQIISSIQTENFILKQNNKQLSLSNSKLTEKINQLETEIFRIQNIEN